MRLNYDCIIFDLGNTLIHDEPVERLYLYYVFEALQEHSPTLTPADFFSARLSLLRAGSKNWVDVYGRAWASDSWESISDYCWQKVLAAWGDLVYMVSGAIDAVKALSGVVPIAVLANQPQETALYLRNLDIARHFDFIGLDSEVGFKKPDTEFFSWALSRGGFRVARVLYVGDRFDNDICPAQAVGMQTAWIKHFPKDFPSYAEPPEWCMHYLESVNTVGTHNQHLFRSDLNLHEPTFTASSVSDLLSNYLRL